MKQDIQQREGFKRILLNVGWLFFDKVLRLGLSFLLNVLIARYLGVDAFGVWNYAIAFVALFSVFSTLGLDNILVKELVKGEYDKNSLLGAAFLLKFVGGIVGFLLALLTIFFLRGEDKLVVYLVLVTASGFIFQSFDVIDYYYQSKLQARFSVYARNGAFLISAVIKLSLLYFKAPLMCFAIATLLELMLSALFLIWIYSYKDKEISIKAWRLHLPVVKTILRDSIPLIFASMVVLIYMRTDQIMLGNMIGDNEVGVFSAAVRLSEIWYFIPSVITTSVLPTIIKAKEFNTKSYLRKLQWSFDIILLLGTITAIVISFFSYFIVSHLYGTPFIKSGPILAVHAWTSVFVFLGFASGNWFIAENLQKYVFYRTAAGALVNVFLNYYLIPLYGGLGAAFATLFSQFVASYFFNLFNTKTLPVFKMQTESFLKILGVYYLYRLAKTNTSNSNLDK